MLELPPSVPSHGHSRVSQRDIERLVRQQLEQTKAAPRPARFRRRVRLTHELLLRTLGPGQVMKVEESRRLAMWAYYELNRDGLYQMFGETMIRVGDEVATSMQAFPLLATPQFFERYTRSLAGRGPSLIGVMLEVVQALLGEVGYDRRAPKNRWPLWSQHGSAQFALPHSLVSGDIPEFGDVVLRHVTPNSRLEPRRLEEWQSIRDSGKVVAVREPWVPRVVRGVR
ncbi:MAG: hypothetical protein FGM43_00640 [Sinobacteraceae bacterium]|nr:hypothetical protein [Nevskiaceae bacterium]